VEIKTLDKTARFSKGLLRYQSSSGEFTKLWLEEMAFLGEEPRLSSVTQAPDCIRRATAIVF
jgi:hypothetical protein